MRGIAVIGAGIVAAGLVWPSGMIVVTDATGAARWRAPTAEGATVTLQYTNSIYLAPTWERFIVRQSRLQLLDVSSASEAVLEYNRLAPPYRVEGGRVVASVSGVVLDEFTLRIGARGRPTLQVGARTLPLYEAGEGEELHIAVRRAPRFLVWLGR